MSLTATISTDTRGGMKKVVSYTYTWQEALDQLNYPESKITSLEVDDLEPLIQCSWHTSKKYTQLSIVISNEHETITITAEYDG